jgi:hypothetical protein
MEIKVCKLCPDERDAPLAHPRPDKQPQFKRARGGVAVHLGVERVLSFVFGMIPTRASARGRNDL